MRGRLAKTGSFTGDGAASQSFDLGFRPTCVIIWNRTDGDKRFEVLDDGANGRAYLIDDSGSDTTNLSVPSNGPTIHSRGFATGTNASIIEEDKVFDYVAF